MIITKSLWLTSIWSFHRNNLGVKCNFNTVFHKFDEQERTLTIDMKIVRVERTRSFKLLMN